MPRRFGAPRLLRSPARFTHGRAGGTGQSATKGVACNGRMFGTGVCGDLKTNADHDLMTTMYVVDASAGPGSKKLVATYKNS